MQFPNTTSTISTSSLQPLCSSPTPIPFHNKLSVVDKILCSCAFGYLIFPISYFFISHLLETLFCFCPSFNFTQHWIKPHVTHCLILSLRKSGSIPLCWYGFFIQLSFLGYLDCFHTLAVVNSAVMSIEVLLSSLKYWNLEVDAKK